MSCPRMWPSPTTSTALCGRRPGAHPTGRPTVPVPCSTRPTAWCFQLDSWLTVSEGQEALAAHAENFPGTVQLEDDAASIANFCLDGIGFVMTHAGEPEIYFMINR